MIERKEYRSSVNRALDRSPVTALLGPRQCGKTTLAKIIMTERGGTYYDLERPQDRARLANPTITLGAAKGLVVLDEIQREPSLFEILRVVVDEHATDARFLVLGSASPHLVKGVSESLAGRIAFVDLSGFNVSEIHESQQLALWLRGGLPPALLADDDKVSEEWRDDFIRTFLERDIPQLGITIPAETIHRFWTMVAHYHGQVWNAAEFARSLGTAEATARRYLDILTGSYVVRQLQPWYENLKKRQVRSPKVYIRDSGILHSLLGLPDKDTLSGHPKIGASWEGFVIEQILAIAKTRDAYFWATHAGAELDLFVMSRGKRVGFEIKYTEVPRISKSMRIAMADLDLDKLHIVHAGAETFELDHNIVAVSVAALGKTVSSMVN